MPRATFPFGTLAFTERFLKPILRGQRRQSRAAAGRHDRFDHRLINSIERVEDRTLLSASVRNDLDDGITRTIVPGEVVLALSTDQPISNLEDHLESLELQSVVPDANFTTADEILTLNESDGTHITLVQIDIDKEADVAAIVSEFQLIDGLSWAAPNYQYSGDILDFTPNDPDYGNQYHHTLMANDVAWDTTLGDSNVVVAITDQGVELNHPDLAANIWQNPGELPNGIDDDNNGYIDDFNGWDFVADDNDPNPLVAGDDHGTHVAGISAGVTDNATGIAGTSGGSSIMALRIQGADGGYTSTIMADTLRYAIDNGAQIANTSFNINGFVGDPIFTAGLQYYHDNGGLHFNSAGNADELNPVRQAFHQTILVASTTASDTKSGFSNYGTGIDVSAPGSSILSTVNGGGYGSKGGTSMAAPNAAGVAALVWSANPTWTRDQVAAAVLGTAVNIDALNPTYIGLLGSGRVNSGAAIAADTLIAAPRIKSLIGLPADGQVLSLESVNADFSFAFDQLMDTVAVNNPANIVLSEAGPNGLHGDGDDGQVSITPAGEYMVGTNELSFSINTAELEIGKYAFTISADVTNPFGNRLDGNSDGTAGDAFQTFFEIVAPPFLSVEPSGSLVHDRTVPGNINFSGSFDRFSIDLDSGQILSIVADATSAVHPAIQVLNPVGVSIGTVAAAAAGTDAVLQAVPITTAGTYSVIVSGASGSTGTYSLRTSINAVVEEEGHDRPSNDLIDSAQDITNSAVALGFGSADRLSVLGDLPSIGEDFESGSLGSAWETSSSTASGRIQVTGAYGTAGGSSALVMDVTSGLNRNEAIWTVDLTGLNDAALRFFHAEWGDEETALPQSFTGSVDGDGVAISDDGVNWYTVLNAPATTAGVWTEANIDLAAAASAAGMTLGPDFKIKFQQYDDFPLTTDGRGYDEIEILTSSGYEDWYAFEVADNNFNTVAVTQVTPGAVSLEVFDENGLLVADGLPSSNVDQLVSQFATTAPNTYYARISGARSQYNLVVTRGGDFDTEVNDNGSLSISQDLSALPNAVAVGSVSALDSDLYSVQVAAGDSLVIETLTPGDGPLLPDNLLDPGIELYDAAGTRIPHANQTGNESLSHTAAMTGTYSVRVLAQAGAGDYVLRIAGRAPSLLPFEVAAITPFDGQISAAPVSEITIDLNDSVLLSSVDAGDVLIDGVPVQGVTFYDRDTVGFQVGQLPGGNHNLSIAAGSLVDLQQTPISAFASQFETSFGPRVTSSSLQEDDVVSGPLTVTLQFDKTLNAATLDPADVSLTGVWTGSHSPSGFNYNSGSSTLTIDYAELPEDRFTLTLLSGDGAFEDSDGNDLDGEPGGGSSGDGTPGGNYSVGFHADTLLAPVPTPLNPLLPLGSLAYDAIVNGTINTLGDSDSYTIDLDADQYLNFVLETDPTVTGVVELLGPGDLLISVDIAASAGDHVFSQTTVPVPLGAGTYTMRVSSAAGTGNYNLRTLVNASIEVEEHSPVSNDVSTDAQTINTSIFPRPGVGPTFIGSVIGTAGPDPDWYRVAFPPNATLTISVTGQSSRDFALDVFDLSGTTQLAKGVTAANLDQVVNRFVNTIGATDLLIRVTETAPSAGEYNLVVTGDADFDTEANSDDANAQVLTPTNAAFGHLTTLPDPAPLAEALRGGSVSTTDVGSVGGTVEYPAREASIVLPYDPVSSFETFFSEGAGIESSGFAEASSLAGPIPVLSQFAGPGATGFIPPDPTVAAGPAQIVAAVNTDIGIYDKVTGAELFLQGMDGPGGFFGSVGATSTVFDPIVLYDFESARFFVVGIDIESTTVANVFVAVSTDSTPTSGTDWHKYKIDFAHDAALAGLGAGIHFPDYEKVGVNSDAIFVSGNYFPITTGSGVYAGITAIEKAPLLTGAPANIVYEEHFSGFSVFPLQQYGVTTTQYFAETTGGGVRIHAIDNVLSGSATRQVFDMTVPAYGQPVNPPQLGGGTAADSIGSRVMSGVLRDDSMWFAHAATDPAIGDGESVARWYEVATNGFGAGGGNPTLVQAGNVDPGPAIHAWMPAINVDGNGNMGIGFATGGPNQFYGAGFTGRLASDPPGDTVLPITEYAVGEANYVALDGAGRNRWGDYTGLALDPVDESTFWVFNEYASTGNTWATEIASFELNSGVDDDWYSFDVVSGDNLTITTFTPGSDPLLIDNTLDPDLQLFDPTGALIPHTNVIGDETLNHSAAMTGVYQLRVFGASNTSGEYQVQLQGASGSDIGPSVVDADPDDGTAVASFPLTYELDFDESILSSSVQPSDLLIGGVPALSVVQLDGDTFEFTIDPAANVGDGFYLVTLADSAVDDLQGHGNFAFVGSFVLDTLGPIITSTLWNGSPLTPAIPAGALTLEVGFNEDLYQLGSARRGPYAPGPDDILLENTNTGDVIPPQIVDYDVLTDVVTITFDDVPEGDYTLTLISGNASFEDAVGNDLDGEAIGPGLDGTPTGNGNPGGNYVIGFSVDITSQPATTFQRLEPMGGLMADSVANVGLINNGGDQDDFTFTAEAGQIISAVVEQLDLTGLQTGIELVGVSPVFIGDDAVLPPHVIPADGVYTIRVSGSGLLDYELIINSNSGVEAFLPGGDSDDGNELAIDDTFIPLESGVGGRYSITGFANASGMSPSNAPLIGVEFGAANAVLHDVDQLTGALSNPRQMDIDNVLDIARSPAGVWYAMTTFGPATGQGDSLYLFDVVTGAATLIGHTGLGGVAEGDLAFDPISGVLFGSQVGNGDLLTLDVTTGVATVVGSVGPSDISALTFDNAGTLFALDTLNELLLTLDPSDASVLSTVGLSVALGAAAGMDFDPGTGQLFVADGGPLGTDTLYTLDPASGLLTAIGPLTGSADGLSGLEFVQQPTPLPTPLQSLFGMRVSTSEIVEIDPITGAIINSFTSPIPNSGFSGISGAENGTTLIVQDDSDPANLFRVDPATGTILSVETMALGLRVGLSYEGTSIFAMDNGGPLERQDGFSGPVTDYLSIVAPNFPGALGGDDNGRHFIFADNLIQEFDPVNADTILNTFPLPLGTNFSGLAYDGSILYAFDDISDEIIWLDPDTGAVLHRVISAAGELSGLGTAIVTPPPPPLPDLVYLVERDLGNNPGGMVSVFDFDGNLVDTIDHAIFDTAIISDVELAPNGDVYVAMDLDDGTGPVGAIAHFQADGTFVQSISIPDHPGTTGPFYPFGFEVLADGMLLVPQVDLANILLLNPDGSVNANYPVPGVRPSDVGVLSDGTIVIADRAAAEAESWINVLQDDRFWVSLPALDTARLHDRTGTLFAQRTTTAIADAQGLADGTLFSSGFNPGTFTRFDPAGAVVFSNPVSSATGIAVASAEVFSGSGSLSLSPESTVEVIIAGADGNRSMQVTPIVAGSETTESVEADAIVNGSFETGDFSGWTVGTTGAPFIDWSVDGAGSGSALGLASTEPQDGAFVAWNGFDGDGPMEFTMFQDVVVPSAGTLSWRYRAQWDFSVGNPATSGRTMSVELLDPATSGLLATLFTFDTGDPAVNPMGDSGWQFESADLGAFSGQTVRLMFREVIPEANTGPGQIEFDDISLDSTGPGGVDVDEYTVNLSTDTIVDVILSGYDGAVFGTELLELLAPDGTTVLATGSPEPLAVGVPVENYDLGILDFVVPTDGVYTVRFTSAIGGSYGLVVTDSVSFETEVNNNPVADPLRDLTVTNEASGFLIHEPGAPGNILDDFEDGDILEYVEYRDVTNATVSGTARHDGLLGLSVADGDGFLVREDPLAQVSQGDLLSTWIRMPAGLDGRAYFSFGASAAGALSVVLGPNSNQFLIQENLAYDFSAIGVASQTYTGNNWYRVEVDWQVGGNIDAYLYDSDGTTLLNTVSANTNVITSGGIGFRAFGAEPYFFDTIERLGGPAPLTEGTEAVDETGNVDYHQIDLVAGQRVSVFTTTPFDGPAASVVNNLDPEILVLHPDGSTVVDLDRDSLDGKNAFTQFFAPVGGTHTIQVRAESGIGEYELNVIPEPRALTLTIDQSTISEGDGAGAAMATVTRNTEPSGLLVVTVNSDDTSEANSTTIVTIAPGAMSATFPIDAVDDLLLDGTQTATFTVAAFQHAGDSVSIQVTDDDTASFSVDPPADTIVSESGTSDSFDVVLDVGPPSDVVLNVAVSDPGEASVDVTSLTFTPADWNVPQEVTVTGVDDLILDGDQLSSVLVSVDAANSYDEFDPLSPVAAAVVTQDNDVPGFTITPPSGGTTVTEGGSTDAFDLVLTVEPLSDVVFQIASGDTGEVSVIDSSVVFTPANWNVAQSVAVQGVDDIVVDGDQTTAVTISLNAGASNALFVGVADQTTNVTTIDDDIPNFVFIESDGDTVVDESGTSDSIDVFLSAEPLTDVVLRVAGNDPGEVDVQDVLLIFTPANWNTPQTVSVTGVDDPAVDGTQTSNLLITVDDRNSDPAFRSVADQTVNVDTTDDDIPGFAVQNAVGLVVSEDGSTDSFEVVLTAQPAADVVLAIDSLNTNEVSVLDPFINFTGINWNIPQPVGLMGVDDTQPDGPQISTIQVSVDVVNSLDAFDSLPTQTVQVTTMDDEPGRLDVDDNGVVDAATDGLLIIRYLFGFTGPALTKDALGPGANVTSPARIVSALDGAPEMLDADGDGDPEGATDGILIIRYMLGFRDEALVDGAIGLNSVRTTGQEVADHLDLFMPSTGGPGGLLSGGIEGSQEVAVAVSGAASGQPTFLWNSVFGADHYRVRIEHLASGLVAQQFTTSDTEVLSQPGLTSGSYRTWVEAINADGTQVIASGWIDFAIVDAETESPVLSVLDNETVVDSLQTQSTGRFNFPVAEPNPVANGIEEVAVRKVDLQSGNQFDTDLSQDDKREVAERNRFETEVDQLMETLLVSGEWVN